MIGTLIGNTTILHFPNQQIYIGIALILLSIPLFMYAVAIEMTEWKQGFKQSQKGIYSFIKFNKKVYDFTNNKIRSNKQQNLLDLPDESIDNDNFIQQETEKKLSKQQKISRKRLRAKANTRKSKPSTDKFELPSTDLLLSLIHI